MEKIAEKALIITCALLLATWCVPGEGNATLVRTRVSGQVRTLWAETPGLAAGDDIFFDFIYDDGNISHEPYIYGSAASFRRYNSTALVSWSPVLSSWMAARGLSGLQSSVASYRLYEPDGTELNEMFDVDNSMFILNIYHSFGSVGDGMYFSLQGQRGGFESYGLAVKTTPVCNVPEPSTFLLMTSVLVLFIAGVKYCCPLAEVSSDF